MSRKKILAFFIFIICVFVVAPIILAMISNPYDKFSLVRSPYTTKIIDDQVVIIKEDNVSLLPSTIFSPLGYFAAGFHILATRYFGSTPLSGTVPSIIQSIHATLFDPSKPYLISGDQFSVFYPRNLGIFYGAFLDPRIGLSQTDWQNREQIYLKSVVYALDAFTKYKNLSTTLVPIGFNSVIPVNIYSYPSDTLYGILYALNSLENSQDIIQTFPFSISQPYFLQTMSIDQTIIGLYKPSLQQLLSTYIHTVYDPSTGLISKHIQLSGARDSVIRQSSFYDNVIYWKTLSLANELGITQYDQGSLNSLRMRILQAFWYPQGGYFLNDLSGQKVYSSDWLIAISTGFLSPQNTTDLPYITSVVSYIQKNGIDKPFPLKYQIADSPTNEFSFVKYFAPSYGNDAIWSHWGIEYIKTLLLLYTATKQQQYLTQAKLYLAIYTDNIQKFGGYPETYDGLGQPLTTPFYKSILINGWVINYEEAEAMMNEIENTK